MTEHGYDVVDQQHQSDMVTNLQEPVNFLQFMWQRSETRLAVLGGLLILPGVIFSELLGRHHPMVDIASISALVAAGLPIARSAWHSLKTNLEININVLMTIAAVGAVFLGAYTEAGMVMVLFAIGEALEGFVANRARNSIRSLVDIVPNKATVLRQRGDRIHEEHVQVEALKVGDIILVKPGEQIPMDGQVVAGVSSVNQAPITGEGRLVEKVAGSEVLAGSINGEGAIQIKVTHIAEDNTINRLIKMVEEAQEKRAPVQRFVDRFAKFYTPVVVLLAILVAIIPPLFFGQPFLNPTSGVFGWLYRGLGLLVVACPCALVISTPVSIISAINNAARKGVLIKGGAHLETLSRVKVIAFDKTGTLTEGKPSVVAVRSIDCQVPDLDSRSVEDTHRCKGCDDLIALASAVERQSEHPLAQAIVREAARRGLKDRYPAAEMVTAHAGKGVTGQIGGYQVTIGSHNHFDNAITHPEEHCLEANGDAMSGFTTVMVSEDGKFQGTIILADMVRQRIREAVVMLKDAGLTNLVMLTGDNQSVAKVVGERTGITDVRGELMPEGKVSAVKQLHKEHGIVAMVGDGINDAPALATADVGIAIGGTLGGTDQAMETSDITLMSEDLRQLPYIYNLSRATMRTIQFNMGLSLVIKFAFILLVMLGLGTMWMAVLADMGTSLLVTLNGVRLLRLEP
ncbi:MAG: heavy metal translocating P-type ATPase [Anaerolineales bacterium]